MDRNIGSAQDRERKLRLAPAALPHSTTAVSRNGYNSRPVSLLWLSYCIRAVVAMPSASLAFCLAGVLLVLQARVSAAPSLAQLEQQECMLHLTEVEKQANDAGIQVFTDGVDPSVSLPTLVIGMFASSASVLLASAAKILVQQYIGYAAVELKLTTAATATRELSAGNIHLLLDVWPSRHFASPDAYAEFSSDESITHLGPLGLTRRAGMYASEVLATRLMKVIAIRCEQLYGRVSPQTVRLANARLSDLSWEELSFYLADAASGAAAILEAATSGQVFLMADSPLQAHVWGDAFSRFCSSSSLVFKPFRPLNLNLTCTPVPGGEESLRYALDSRVCAQNRADVLVMLPEDSSDLAQEPFYAFQRLNLPRSQAACFGAGECEWPRDVLQKYAWAGVRDYFPLDLLSMFTVSLRHSVDVC